MYDIKSETIVFAPIAPPLIFYIHCSVRSADQIFSICILSISEHFSLLRQRHHRYSVIKIFSPLMTPARFRIKLLFRQLRSSSSAEKSFTCIEKVLYKKRMQNSTKRIIKSFKFGLVAMATLFIFSLISTYNLHSQSHSYKTSI